MSKTPPISIPPPAPSAALEAFPFDSQSPHRVSALSSSLVSSPTVATPIRTLGAVARAHEPLYINVSSPGSPLYPISHFHVPEHYKDSVSSVLIPHGLIMDRIQKLAHDIRSAYAGETIHLLCVLKGGSAFFQELQSRLRSFHTETTQTYIPYTFDFIRAKSYVGTQSTGHVTVSGCDLDKLRGRHVLLVEDIIDTGTTMSMLLPMLDEYGPKSVKVASLLEKRTHKSCGFKGDFVGFSIPDEFVIGYCLDYNDAFRDMEHICVISEAGIEKFKGGISLK